MRTITESISDGFRIVVEDVRIKIGDYQKKLLKLRMDRTYPDYYRVHVDYYTPDGNEFYADRYCDDPRGFDGFTMCDGKTGILIRKFDTLDAMTSWVKANLS